MYRFCTPCRSAASPYVELYTVILVQVRYILNTDMPVLSVVVGDGVRVIFGLSTCHNDPIILTPT